ncbi:MAG: glycyl-radical enzyme activating protein [Anaerolineae bacterium]
MTSGIVFDVKRFSIHDGPGIRTTVFLKGCPLNCLWCHNPESQASGPELMLRPNRCIHCGACVDACPHGALSWRQDEPHTDAERCTLCGACTEACYAEAREMVGREMTVEQVMRQIKRDVAFYDESGGGATFSGGEPLLQPDFLLALLQACQSQRIHTAVDTSGFAPWEILDRVRRYTDLFLYDLKLVDDARHRQTTGVSNAMILSNLRALSHHGHTIVLRVPIIPRVNDGDATVDRIGALAASLPALQQVDLLPYHPIGEEKYRRMGRTYPLDDVRMPSQARMAEIASRLRKMKLNVTAGG